MGDQSRLPPEPSVCPQCHAVYHRGRWLWERVAENAPAHLCTACRRVQDKHPGAALVLIGGFVETHRSEILDAARQTEAQVRERDALQRIMDVQNRDGSMLITTTELQLARDLGEALRRKYGGEINSEYREGMLHVTWRS